MFGQTSQNFNPIGRSVNSLSARKQMYNSTSSSFGKPLSKSSFVMRRSTSFTNTQGRLDNLNQDLTILDSEVKAMRDVTKENRTYVKFMREDLVDRRLVSVQTDLAQQIKNLSKAVGISKRSDKLKYDGIIQTVEQLRKNSKSIAQQLHHLTERMIKVENAMGFYCGAEKHQ